MKRILDLKKGDKVFGGVTRSGNGFATNAGYIEKFEVRAIEINIELNASPREINKDANLLLRLKCGDFAAYARGLFDQCVYASEEDYYDGNAIAQNITIGVVIPYLADKLGLECVISKHNTIEVYVWEWDNAEKMAKMKVMTKFKGDLLAPKLPEGLYATREECIKANKKMATIEVMRTYMTQREEGEDAEYLLNNPDEYEFKDGDECVSDARYAD